VSIILTACPFKWYWRDSTWLAPCTAFIARTLEGHAQVAVWTSLSAIYVIVFVQSIQMTKAIGSDRRFPVITRMKTEPSLLAEVQVVVVENRSIASKGASAPETQGK
jgi:hypothetical protein